MTSDQGGAQQAVGGGEPPSDFATASARSVSPESRAVWDSHSDSPASGRPRPSGPAANEPTARRPAISRPPMTLRGSPIRLGDGEQVIREYRAVQLKTQKRGEGTLYVTDARIVFFARAAGRGPQRASSLVQQTRLEDVSGLQAFVSRRTSILLIAFAVFVSLVTLGALLSQEWTAFIVFFVLAGASLAAIFGGAAERGRAGVKIHSREEDVSAIRFGHFGNQRSGLEAALTLLIFPVLMFLRAQTAFDVMLGRPGKDSDRLISELGALILDLQTRGQLAADYWAAAPAAEMPVRGSAAS
ncbi:MAG: hypothetical protein ABSF03_27215 [Streptosporangiaceae bacterium]|jgi:hypothetical protein